MSEGFAEFHRHATISCWIVDPAPVIVRMLNSNGIPIRIPAENLFIILFPAETQEVVGNYEAVIRLQFETASQARGIATALALAANFVVGSIDPMLSSVFFANAPVQNGRNLDIKTAQFTKDEIAGFLKDIIFSE